MHPAFSLIFLTTLIGAGQGLFIALMAVQTYTLIEIIPLNNATDLYGIGALLSVLLLLLGLGASFFHLGHPERAWRAASQWRTSWMSREVIILPMTMMLIFAYGLVHYFSWDMTVFSINQKITIQLSYIVGTLGVVCVFLLFLCTSMIYIAIKFIQEWASPLTFINYTLLGIASGFGVAGVLAAYQHSNLVNFFIVWAALLTGLSAVTRAISLWRNAYLKPKSTPKSAIGLHHKKIHQISQGAMGGSYNTREYFHGQNYLVVQTIKWLFIVLVFFIPVALWLIAQQNDSETDRFQLVFISAIVQYIGLIAERWFFFAQANHPQNIYYQST